MSRYDDLRRMREAKFARHAVTKPAPDSVTKPKAGRPTIGNQPMTAAERMRRHRANKKAGQDEHR